MSQAQTGPAVRPTTVRWWHRRLVVYPLLFLAVTLIMPFAGCAEMFLLHPTTDARRCPAERTEVPLDRGVVEVFRFRVAPRSAGKPDVLVLEFGGNAERAEDGVRLPYDFVRRHRAEVWRVYLPGFGGSTGPARLRSIPPAALAAFDAIAAVAAGRPIVLSANSIGGTAALYVASQRPGRVAALLLRNPPPLRRLIIGHYGWWNLWLPAMMIAWSVPVELNAPDTAPLVRAPAVFVTCDEDGIVPPAYQAKVIDAYGGAKHLITVPGAGHNDELPAEVEAEIAARLGDLLPSPSPTN